VVDDARPSVCLPAPDALALWATFAARGIGCWVMGGWGVDALLGEETRPHHDLDLLVSRSDLAELFDVLAELGFVETLVWGESRWVDVHGLPCPTAFVQADPAGRELDVHVVELHDDGPPTALCDVPWLFDVDSLTAVGLIGGTEVRCVSAETQLQMHTGYDLPPEHRRDAERLTQFLLDAAPTTRSSPQRDSGPVP
jgi:lincosamide nucleotidyltransferase A/C/D/E